MRKNKSAYNVQLLSSDEQIDIYDFIEFLEDIDFSIFDYSTVLDYSKFNEDFNFRIAIIEHENKTVYLETCFDKPYTKRN